MSHMPASPPSCHPVGVEKTNVQLSFFYTTRCIFRLRFWHLWGPWTYELSITAQFDRFWEFISLHWFGPSVAIRDGNLQMSDINVRWSDFGIVLDQRPAGKTFNWDILHGWASKCIPIHLVSCISGDAEKTMNHTHINKHKCLISIRFDGALLITPTGCTLLFGSTAPDWTISASLSPRTKS